MPVEDQVRLAFGLLMSQQIWENASREGFAQSAKFLLLPQHTEMYVCLSGSSQQQQ